MSGSENAVPLHENLCAQRPCRMRPYNFNCVNPFLIEC